MNTSRCTLLALLLTGWATSALCHLTPTPAVSKEEALKQVLEAPQPSGVAAALSELQALVKANPQDLNKLERLGRLWIGEARVTHNERGYQLAALCARLMDMELPEQPSTLLLRGNVLLAMHRFHDAEELGRVLLQKRQNMLDHALLADALMEQGLIEESLPVYQAMIDTKPCLPSYSRIAHVRWLRGDIDGAIEMMEQAIACGSYRDPEPMAWCTSRLAFFLWQDGDAVTAMMTAKRSVEILPENPQAYYVMGRILLSRNDAQGAADALEKAANYSQQPEILWALADAQRAAYLPAKAEATMKLLSSKGEAGDPRSFSLYLATQHQDSDHALDLAKAELHARRDVYSWDALAWAQQAAGSNVAALISARKAMAEGTKDARLFLHACIIAQQAGDAKATEWLAQARAMRAQLLPSEQDFLDRSNASAAVEKPRSDVTQ